MRRKTIERLQMLAVAVFFVGALALCSWYEHNYTRDAVVVGYVEDLVTFEDTCGFTWEAYADELEVGDEVVLKMFDGCTPFDIDDDEVTGIKLK